MVTTLEDTPMGVSVPVVRTVSFFEIDIRWSAPEIPNGVILSYHLLRKFIGFKLSEDTLNCCEDFIQTREQDGNGTSLDDTCQLVTMTTAPVTSHIDDELQPYTFYQYCIVVTNNADSAFSPQTPPSQTQAAPMPLIGPQLNATTINSTAIELTWGSLEVSDLLGPLIVYELYVRISGEERVGDVIFRDLAQSFTAVDLLASTEYVFVVAVSNGEGVTFGNNASATTDEGSKLRDLNYVGTS